MYLSKICLNEQKPPCSVILVSDRLHSTVENSLKKTLKVLFYDMIQYRCNICWLVMTTFRCCMNPCVISVVREPILWKWLNNLRWSWSNLRGTLEYFIPRYAWGHLSCLITVSDSDLTLGLALPPGDPCSWDRRCWIGDNSLPAALASSWLARNWAMVSLGSSCGWLHLFWRGSTQWQPWFVHFSLEVYVFKLLLPLLDAIFYTHWWFTIKVINGPWLSCSLIFQTYVV